MKKYEFEQINITIDIKVDIRRPLIFRCSWSTQKEISYVQANRFFLLFKWRFMNLWMKAPESHSGKPVLSFLSFTIIKQTCLQREGFLQKTANISLLSTEVFKKKLQGHRDFALSRVIYFAMLVTRFRPKPYGTEGNFRAVVSSLCLCLSPTTVDLQ